MIETTPSYDINEALGRMNDSAIASKIKEINNAYLYWDKIKYAYLYWDKIKYKKLGTLTAQQIWNSTKLVRLINYKNITLHNHHFNYYNTDFIQKSLHQFDMHIGGYLGAKSVIPENDKTRYLVSSIMEEAISSSIMEGAATTRKKAKEMLRKEIKPKNKSDQMIETKK